MRRSTRFGSLAGSAVLGLVAVLGGAGVSSANAPDGSTVASQSVLSVERDSLGQPVMSYDNKSGLDLDCQIILGSQSVIDAIDNELKRISNPFDWFVSLTYVEPETQDQFGRAVRAGEFNLGLAHVDKGHSGPVTFAGDMGYELDTDFTLHGIAGCRGEGDPEDYRGVAMYIEFERAPVVNQLRPAPVFGSGS